VFFGVAAALAALVCLTLVIALPLTLRHRTPMTAQQVILDAFNVNQLAMVTGTQTVTVSSTSANPALAELASSLSVPSFTILGAAVQIINGVSAGTELQQIDPILASLPVSSGDVQPALLVVTGTCGNIIGLSSVSCALIAYDPQLSTDPSAIVQDAHVVLAVSLSATGSWSPAQLAQTQGADLSALACLSWAGGGTVVASVQSIPEAALVRGINFAVAGSAAFASASCPLSAGDLLSASMSATDVFALVTLPYQNWLAGAQLSITAAGSSVAVSLASDTVGVALNNVALQMAGLSATTSITVSGQLVLTLPATQPLTISACPHCAAVHPLTRVQTRRAPGRRAAGS
jgi:hypothetical protein